MEFCLTKPTHLWRIIQFTKIVAGELCVVVKAIYVVKKIGLKIIFVEDFGSYLTVKEMF